MNKTLTKILTIFSCLAIQGCIVEIDPRSPRPRPDIPCHGDWHCPIDSYCEVDGYCYEEPFYTECYHDFDCPMTSYCAPNGLCYEDFYHHGECHTSWDCPAHWYCAGNGLCYQDLSWLTQQDYFGFTWCVYSFTQWQTSHQKKSVCLCVAHHHMNWLMIGFVSVGTISYEKR